MNDTTEPPILQVGLSQNNSFKSDSQTSTTIGPLRMLTSNSKTLIIGNSTDNLQTLTMTLPQNKIDVRITTYDERTIWFDPLGNDLSKYILIMSFEKVM